MFLFDNRHTVREKFLKNFVSCICPPARNEYLNEKALRHEAGALCLKNDNLKRFVHLPFQSDFLCPFGRFFTSCGRLSGVSLKNLLTSVANHVVLCLQK